MAANRSSTALSVQSNAASNWVRRRSAIVQFSWSVPRGSEIDTTSVGQRSWVKSSQNPAHNTNSRTEKRSARHYLGWVPERAIRRALQTDTDGLLNSARQANETDAANSPGLPR